LRETQADKALRFERLVAPLERQVYFTCLQLMGNPQDAEDCAQEGLLKAFRKLDSFRGRSSFSTWLYTLVTRTCLDALRARREQLSLDELAEAGYQVPDDKAEVYLRLEAQERKAALRRAIQRLPAEFRAVVVLVDLQGLPYLQSAQVLGIPEGTLKSRLSRARAQLYKILLEDGELFDEGKRPNDERRDRHEL